MSRRSPMLVVVSLLAFFSIAAKENGCQAEDSSSVDQSRVYTSYWLFYDANANATSARAQFRFGHALGTALELKAPATATFSGQAMAFNPVLQWHEVKQTGSADGGTFVYVDTAGTRFSNEARVTKTVDFPADFPTKLQRSKGFTLTWVGPALSKGEDLELVVVGEQSTNFIRVDQFDTGATSITVPADQLTRIGGANATINLRRHDFVDDLNAPDAGGRVQLTFEQKARVVPLE